MTAGLLKTALIATVAALALSACASTNKPAAPALAAAPPATPSLLSPTPGLTVSERIAKVVTLLQLGQTAQARVEVLEALSQEPSNPVANKLLGQIDMNPHLLLGDKSYAYKVRRGDDMQALAGKLLGDPMLFYALARYNDVTFPAGPHIGQILRIPGVRKKAVAKPVVTAPTTAAVSASPPSQPVRDPRRASALRGQALENMNSGAIDTAVTRLRQAQVLDPDNSLIKRDLDRAVRIQTTVRSR